MYNWINQNGGVTSTVWAPLISYKNLYLEWFSKYPTITLNVGALNLLRAFSVYHARILEQALIDLYSPYLNDTNVVAFFNFTLSPADLVIKRINDLYLVWDAVTGALIFTASAIKDLASKLGVARSTVKIYLNWATGLEINLANVKTKCLLRKQGDNVRLDKVANQLSYKDRYSKINLTGRSLNDLDPGRTYVIDPSTTNTAYGPFDSRLDVFKTLYPNKWDKISGSATEKSLTRNFIANNITAVMNTAVPGGVVTELGKFWFCCNPDHPFKYNKLAKALFTVSPSGLCTWYPNNSSIHNFSRKMVALHRANSSVYKGVRLVDEAIMLNLFPNTPTGPGVVFQLSAAQLALLNKSLG